MRALSIEPKIRRQVDSSETHPGSGISQPHELVNSAILYKPPVSFDPVANDLSFQLSLKPTLEDEEKLRYSTILNITPESHVHDRSLKGAWSSRNCILERGGTTEQSRPFAIEHYADGLDHDKITMICPSGQKFPEDQLTRMKWLHLEKATLCPGDLVDIVKACPFLDEDYATLALRLLQTECPKFEKRFSNGKRTGYYIEPGTVLRYDGRYSHDLSRGEKSVLFCSTPYLNLEKPRGSSEDLGTSTEHIHRTRTLLESLYDFDHMDKRDGKQVVCKNAAVADDAIICVPQVWYLLCGSILISCGQASLAELRGDSIQEKHRSDKSLIAHVTDLDNHHFTVALKTTDPYFTVIRIMELSRSNLGGGSINNYDIELEGGEFLTPRTWLEIVKRNPTPSLKLTLKARTPLASTSLALIVIPKTGVPMNDACSKQSQNDRDNGKVFDTTRGLDDEYSDSGNDSKASDSHGDAPYFNSSNGSEVMSLRKSIPTQKNVFNYSPRHKLLTFDEHNTHALPNAAYHLTSFTGALVRRDDDSMSQDKGRNSCGDEDTNDRSEETLVDSLVTQHENEERQISDLRSNGIIVNDLASLSAAPDVFKLEPTSPQGTSKDSKYGMPNVRDILGPEDDGESSFTAGTGFRYKKPVLSRSEGCETRNTATMSVESINSKYTDSGEHSIPFIEEHHVKDKDGFRPTPFLQWRYMDPTSGLIDSDDIVRRVLDQINERLRRSEGFKKYQKTPECNLEELHEELTSSLNDDAGTGPGDKIIYYRKKKLSELKPKLFALVKALIEMFIPINFEHDVTRKIWGGMHTIWRYMDNIDVSKPRSRVLVYHVQGYEKDGKLWQAMGMDAPTVPFDKCQGCSGGFSTFNEGMMHLRAVHFDVKYIHAPQSAEASLGLYLRTPQQIQTEAPINILESLVQEINSIFNNLLERAQQLQLGARKPDTSDDENGYPVMGRLVRAFESVTLLITTMTFEVSRVSRLMKQNDKKTQDSQSLLAKLRRSLNQVNTEVQKHLENAKIDMIITSRTDSLSGGVTLSSIGPEFMIAMMSSGMFLRQLKDATGNTIDTCELYKKYTTSLQFQVNQRPQRRSFADMYALEEELDILRKVIYWQRKFCNNLMRVLDPASYKMTTKGRISHFRLESHYISRTLTRLEARDIELAALESRTRSLREQLKQSIEIREESHGKAIRVFTVVTAFFLPLSFVTSFMGMNTTDIRDIDKDQKIFWIIALPTTIVVMGLAFVYGYKWDAWKEETVRRRKMQPRHPSMIIQRQATWSGLASQVCSRSRQRGGHAGDIESGVRRQETDLSYSSSLPKEKRVRFWGLGNDKES